MNDYLSSASLKSLAKGQMLGNYGTLVGAYAIHMACVFAASISALFLVDTSTVIGNIIYYAVSFIISLLGGLLIFGETYIYLKLACNQKVTVGDLFYGFSYAPDKILKVQAVFALISLICNLPNEYFVSVMASKTLDPYRFLLAVALLLAANIASVILSLTFAQSFLLLLDFPAYTAGDALTKSHKIMKGNKGRLFYIELSFVPLFFLGLFTLCIGFLWILPYYQAAKANFYLDLMKKR